MAQRHQRGWLKKEKRAQGETWVLFFRTTRKSDGKRVENKTPIGLVRHFPEASSAWPSPFPPLLFFTSPYPVAASLSPPSPSLRRVLRPFSHRPFSPFLSGRQQRFYSHFSPKLHHGDEPILKVRQWLQKSDVSTLSVSTMAAKARMGERIFLRRFQKATGLTRTEYVQHLRVEKARESLEFSSLAMKEIAWKVG